MMLELSLLISVCVNHHSWSTQQTKARPRAARLFYIIIICCHFYVHFMSKPMWANCQNTEHQVCVCVCLWSISIYTIWCATFTGQPFHFVWWPHSARSHRLPISMIFIVSSSMRAAGATFYANQNIASFGCRVTGTRHLYANSSDRIKCWIEYFLVSNGPRLNRFQYPSTHNRRSFMISITLFIYQHSTQYVSQTKDTMRRTSLRTIL